ncbi:hypothetical protein CEXT_597321 [Caerostris extrusa]|uniref:Uncharacterized protein n=1 Tax=Caerostris extrusa TaxID=172846 RepID=A0AAV4QC84_CAEEX|nr:hypothetical protein CEXT_597321 [Caerostris extrusa]
MLQMCSYDVFSACPTSKYHSTSIVDYMVKTSSELIDLGSALSENRFLDIHHRMLRFPTLRKADKIWYLPLLRFLQGATGSNQVPASIAVAGEISWWFSCPSNFDSQAVLVYIVRYAKWGHFPPERRRPNGPNG